MKKINYLILAAISIFGFSCSNNNGFTPIFRGNIDGGDWMNNNTIGYYGGGHTGDCSSKVDSAHQFSYGFCKLANEISADPIKKVKVSVWVKLTDLVKKTVLVLSVDSKNKKSIFWEGRDVNPVVNETQKWYKFSTEFKLPNFENEGAKISIYIWNPHNNIAFVDDFEISFFGE
ncbi:MAG: hypothetical protein ABR968_13505 [Bacteroidales bacterium]